MITVAVLLLVRDNVSVTQTCVTSQRLTCKIVSTANVKRPLGLNGPLVGMRLATMHNFLIVPLFKI